MPSSLVNRYSVYVHLPGQGKVRRPIARDPSLFLAVESCISAYGSTGHDAYVIEDMRRHRVFRVDRTLLLRVLLLKSQNETLYFDIMNRLDRSGGQDEMESFLADHAAI